MIQEQLLIVSVSVPVGLCVHICTCMEMCVRACACAVYERVTVGRCPCFGPTGCVRSFFCSHLVANVSADTRTDMRRMHVVASQPGLQRAVGRGKDGEMREGESRRGNEIGSPHSYFLPHSPPCLFHPSLFLSLRSTENQF